MERERERETSIQNTLFHFIRTQYDIFTHRNVFLCVAGLAPCGQRVNRHKIGLKFTVGVGEDASEFGDELCGTVLEGSQEESLRVVVVGVDVVPDDRRSPQDS